MKKILFQNDACCIRNLDGIIEIGLMGSDGYVNVSRFVESGEVLRKVEHALGEWFSNLDYVRSYCKKVASGRAHPYSTWGEIVLQYELSEF